jgi:two-component system, NarL family, sensor histidine kinase DegS
MFSNEKLDIEALDVIFNRMLETITNSKDDIFVISEQSRRSFEDMQQELQIIRSQIKIVIDEGDYLDNKVQLAKQRLVIVSKDFDKYSEQQVKEAYETANQLQIEHSLNKAEEKRLRDKRDDLERRMKVLYDTIERADHIVNQVNVVISYFSTDLKNVTLALEEAKIKQDFGIKIITAQEEERKRLSREIHDGPAQMMANVLMRTDLIERIYREKGIEQALAELTDLKQTVRNALSEVRRIIYDLRPMALDDLGIIPTLKKYISTTMEYNPGIDINFLSSGCEILLPKDYEVAIFRLVQECINNALKHANPTEINVKVEWAREHINVVVKDNGIGFNKEEVKPNSFGLIGLQERIDLLKGSMDVQSVIGQGTLIMFQISYPKN